ncbi:MAG: hypothetical protein HUU19_05470 [Phycisphaerales bacterium]|nr:hypothetical protein [Phycisphaerales bacterium]
MPEAGESKLKKILSIVGASAALLVLAIVVLRATLLAPPDAGDLSRRRTVIDTKTGEIIRDFVIPEDSTMPWTNPKTGEKTLIQGEACYWTKDGKAKLEPTYVLLNEMTGKPGPTICPDCGRTVVAHNPLPPADLLREAKKAAENK